MSLVAKETAHAIPFPPLAAKRREAGKGRGRDPRLAAKLSLPPGKLVGGAENGTEKHPGDSGRTKKKNRLE